MTTPNSIIEHLIESYQEWCDATGFDLYELRDEQLEKVTTIYIRNATIGSNGPKDFMDKLFEEWRKHSWVMVDKIYQKTFDTKQFEREIETRYYQRYDICL
tara:strand:+ start:1130 stop:1432 length:303 start_codon:yes stop_codon:yes gene_type:complete